MSKMNKTTRDRIEENNDRIRSLHREINQLLVENDRLEREIAEPDLIMVAVCDVVGRHKNEVLSQKRHAEYVDARRHFAAVARSLGMSQQQVANYLGMDRSTISYQLVQHENLLFSDEAYRANHKAIRKYFSLLSERDEVQSTRA
jgi:predicted transcriptional regulator